MTQLHFGPPSVMITFVPFLVIAILAVAILAITAIAIIAISTAGLVFFEDATQNASLRRTCLVAFVS